MAKQADRQREGVGLASDLTRFIEGTSEQDGVNIEREGWASSRQTQRSSPVAPETMSRAAARSSSD